MRRFRRKRRMPHRRRRLFGLFVALAAALCAVLMLNALFAHVFRAYAATEAHTMGVRRLNDAVGRVLDETDTSAESLMQYEKNTQGEIVAVQANTTQMNALKRKVIDAAMSELETMTAQKIAVPLGTVLGGALLVGQGPPVHLRFVPIATVDASFQSSFTSAGVNQTRQVITLTVKCDVYALLAGQKAGTHVQNDYLVADSVIVGTVPNTYFSGTSGSAGYSYAAGEAGASAAE